MTPGRPSELLPVIGEVSRRAKIRPERAMSMSVIASLQGVVASPVSAVTVAMTDEYREHAIPTDRMSKKIATNGRIQRL
jgi:anaerobic C4-dicarboxylate transporter